MFNTNYVRGTQVNGENVTYSKESYYKNNETYCSRIVFTFESGKQLILRGKGYKDIPCYEMQLNLAKIFEYCQKNNITEWVVSNFGAFIQNFGLFVYATYADSAEGHILTEKKLISVHDAWGNWDEFPSKLKRDNYHENKGRGYVISHVSTSKAESDNYVKELAEFYADAEDKYKTAYGLYH